MLERVKEIMGTNTCQYSYSKLKIQGFYLSVCLNFIFDPPFFMLIILIPNNNLITYLLYPIV